MNKPFNDGGLAFPCPPVIHADHGVLTHGASGMSMREWYAATVSVAEFKIDAMSQTRLKQLLGDADANLSFSEDVEVVVRLVARATAKVRFMAADAMIAESMRRPE